MWRALSPSIQSYQQMRRKASDRSSNRFADPTYDYTFKDIFHEVNLNLVRDFLNDMLGFEGRDLIEELQIINPAINPNFRLVASTVDVRCKTKDGKEIAIEMQRNYKDYFLPRTQSYVAQMIASQVKRGESSQYHTKMKDTYVLVIAKEDLFVRDYEFKNTKSADDVHFEKTVVPYVTDLKEEVPGNKMYWKFFELRRFERYIGNLSLEELNSHKIQWLKFFTDCGTIEKIPPGIDGSIKRAYELMDMEKWDRDKQLKYWELKSLADGEAEERKREAEEHEREVKRLKEEKQEAEVKAELKGEVKILIDLIKGGMDLETLQKFLSSAFDTDQISTVYYQVNLNPDCHADDIIGLLGKEDQVKEKAADKMDS